MVASVVDGLGSTDPSRVSVALNIHSDQSVPPSVLAGIKALQPLNIDYTQLRIVTPGTAQVPATTKDGRRWLLTLVFDGRWYLAEADPR